MGYFLSFPIQVFHGSISYHSGERFNFPVFFKAESKIHETENFPDLTVSGG